MNTFAVAHVVLAVAGLAVSSLGGERLGVPFFTFSLRLQMSSPTSSFILQDRFKPVLHAGLVPRPSVWRKFLIKFSKSDDTPEKTTRI
jgi:hypothetical protein